MADYNRACQVEEKAGVDDPGDVFELFVDPFRGGGGVGELDIKEEVAVFCDKGLS